MANFKSKLINNSDDESDLVSLGLESSKHISEEDVDAEESNSINDDEAKGDDKDNSKLAVSPNDKDDDSMSSRSISATGSRTRKNTKKM